MEKEYQISWFKIIGIVALIAIIVIIICLVYPKNNNSDSLLTQQTYISNITLMKNAGFEYFKGSNLPEEVGDTTRLTLDEMLARNLIIEFTDEEGNSCDLKNSYIEASKTMDNEYEMGVYLSCDNKSDYIVTSISNEVVCTDCEVITNDNNSVATNLDNNGTTTSASDISITPTYSDNNMQNLNTNTTTTTADRPLDITQTTDVNVNVNVNVNCVNSSCPDNNDTCGDDCLANVYYSVVFDSNGGSPVRTQIVKSGGLAQYVESYRYGYEFLGWYLNGEKYDFATPVTHKITLVAKWKKIDVPEDKETHIVDFDSNGGSSVPSQEIEDGNQVVKPTDPVRECYEFAGWYVDKALTVPYDFATPVTSDMTLYAKWVDDGSCKEMYLVKFDSNGGSSVNSQRVEEGAKAVEPEDPTRNGYTFLGWYLNGRLFNFNTRIYEDITLVAKWEKNTEQYNKYCKIESDTYYSVSYIGAYQNPPITENWTAEFTNLYNVQNVKVIDYGHLTTLAMYNQAYQQSFDKGLYMVGSDGQKDVPITSGYDLRTYSLKSNNFTPVVGTPYYSNGSWYINLGSRISNKQNAKYYYAANINSNIYFVPFYFDVEYTNLNNCVTDKASNSYKYKHYEVVSSFWK